MPDRSFLDWPFFEDRHRALARDLEAWAQAELEHLAEGEELHGRELDERTRDLVRRLGRGGWLRHAVPAEYGGAASAPAGSVAAPAPGAAGLDVRSLCLVRETLARFSGLADVAFAMQGLGTGPISRFGSEELKRHYLPPVARGEKIAAFAISEPDAGSDVAAMRTEAVRDGAGFVINGQKTWISNAGIADHYVVFCRFAEAGERGFIALVVDASTPGLEVTDRIEVAAPHPIGTVTFTDCRVGEGRVVGEPGAGLKVALATLDLFRPSVGAAALGFARRALDESLEWCSRRRAFGKLLAAHQLTQARLAEMALEVDAAALLVYRAAWTADRGAGHGGTGARGHGGTGNTGGSGRVTREAAMAKLYATEAAQRVVDSAVQLFGGRGVAVGETVERLYREVRALRIYEGTSEIQKLVIAGQIVATGEGEGEEEP